MGNKEIKEAVELLGKAYQKLDAFPYLVFYTSQDALATVVGLRTSQKIRAVSLYTPLGNMTDSYSHSLFLNTKDRFYDAKNGLIVAFQAVGKENIDQAKRVDYDYQKYIHTFGKLPKKSYYVSNTFFSSESILHDNYLSEDKNQALAKKEPGTHIVYGFLPYEINEDSVLNATIKQDENGMVLQFGLDIHMALDYYLVQMLSTGALYDYPKFTSSKVEFHLNKDGIIEQVKAIDIYTAKTGFVSASLIMESNYIFLTSETGKFKYKGKEFEQPIPKQNEKIELYELFD